MEITGAPQIMIAKLEIMYERNNVAQIKSLDKKYSFARLLVGIN